MGQTELESGGAQIDPMAFGDRPQIVDTGTDLGGRDLIFIVAPTGEDARIIGAADHDPQVASFRLGHQVGERVVMIEQRIATGDEETVGIAALYRDLAGLDTIDPEAPAFDDTLLSQFGKRDGGPGKRGIEDIPPALAMEVPGGIVDPDIIEPIGTETLEALLQRATGAVCRIIVDDPVGQSMFEQAALFTEVPVPGFHLIENDATDLGAEQIILTAIVGDPPASLGCTLVR